jgi:hypothetical protein
VAPEDTNDGRAADLWARCDFDSTTVGEVTCQRHGEVRLDGSLLCVAHAKLARLEVREDLLLGTAFEMDKWLDDPGSRADPFRWRRVLRQRDETVEQLRSNRTLLESHREQNL